MHGWPQRPPGGLAHDGEGGDADPGGQAPARSRLARWVERQLDERLRGDGDDDVGLSEIMSRSLDTMQAQIARVQLALDPPELVIRIPRDACLFYEFWRAKELIALGREEADKALDAAGY